MDEINIANLLKQVSSLNARYEKLTDLTGENFNIFRILKIESSEVRLHSIFIGELLNPNGSHGQKDTFLKLFVKSFNFNGNNFESEGAFVEIEKHIGFITDDKSEGGRIDILITDNKHNHIAIENKIYAYDRINQLLRYKNHSKKAELYYLSLDGKPPKEFSSSGLTLDIDYKCLSYKEDILNWLISCRKEVTTLPIIRETITQYIHLIKYLNNQSISFAMTEELASIINSNIQAAFITANNLKLATNKLLDKFHLDMLDLSEEVKSLGYLYTDDYDINSRYIGFYFFKEDWEHCSICISLQEYSKFLRYGIITNKDPALILIPIQLREKLESLTGVKSKNMWWPILMQMEAPYNKNWDQAFEPWEAISNGKMKEIVRRNLFELIKLLGDLKL